jgi:hypothetical protein
MRRVETCRGSKRFVLALDPEDLIELGPTFDAVRLEWAKEWQRRGSRDEGSCCLGVGVSVYYLPPGKRRPERKQVISWTWSQGDLEADRTRHLPLGMLAEHGVLGVYDQGNMD